MDWLLSLFSVNGRIGRRTWWFTSIAVGISFGILMAVFTAVLGLELMVVDPTSGMPTGQVNYIAALPLIVLYVAFMWICVALSVKRLHDNDMRGWWYLMIFVPLLGGLGLLIICGFIKGDEDENRFGGPVV